MKLVSDRTPRTLPSNTKVNPRGHVNFISVRYIEEVPEKETIAAIQGNNSNKEELMASVVPTSKKAETGQGETNKKSMVEAYKLEIPYRAILICDRSEDEMMKIVDMFKQLTIKLSLCDLLF